MKRDLASMLSGAVMPGDDASAFVRAQLDSGEPQLPQYDPEAGWGALKGVGYMGASMLPGGGIADAAGQLGGPSLAQNVRDRNYGPAALQALGAGADFAGPLGIGAKGLAGLFGGAVKAAAGSKAIPAMILGGSALDRAMPGARQFATQLEQEGKSAQRILEETGLHKGADVSKVDPTAPDAWRGELSDHGMKLVRDPASPEMSRGVKLPEFVHHPDLFDANPGLANMDVIRHDGARSPYFAEPGVFHQLPQGGIVYRAEDAADLPEFLETIGHETNHASDYLSRLPAGGNERLIGNPRVQSALWDFANGLKPDDPLRKLYESLRLKGNPGQEAWGAGARELYFRQAGENAAYATGDRREFGPSLRRLMSIHDPSAGGYMRPIDEQIAVPQGFWKQFVERLQGRPSTAGDLFAGE